MIIKKIGLFKNVIDYSSVKITNIYYRKRKKLEVETLLF